MKTTLYPVALLGLTAGGLLSAQAQRVMRADIFGSPDSQTAQFGDLVVAMGDVNNDLAADYAVSAPADSGGSDQFSGAGTVRMISGLTGQVLWSRSGTAGWVDCSGASGADSYSQAMVDVPDVTGDGIPELAVGAPGAGVQVGGCMEVRGRVELLNGSTGAVIRSWTGQARGEDFGVALAAVAGRLAVLTSQGASPRVEQFDLTTGALFFNHSVAADTTVLVNAGDYNGDGVQAEFAVATPTLQNSPVTVIDAMTGFPVGPPITTPGGALMTRFGAAIAVQPGSASDVLLIGEPGAMIAGMASGRIIAVDFSTGVPVLSIPVQGTQGEGLGERIDFGGDFDADGVPDTLIQTFDPLQPAQFLPGAGGGLQALTGSAQGLALYWAASFVGDTDGNGFDDVAVQFLDANTGDFGIELISGGPAATSNPGFGAGCPRAPGGLAALAQNAPLIPGTNPTFTLTNLGGYDFMVFLIGFPDATGTVLPSGCTLFLSSQVTLQMVPSLGGATSFTTVPVVLPLDYSTLGVSFAFQSVLIPPGGGLGQFATTNAISASIGW